MSARAHGGNGSAFVFLGRRLELVCERDAVSRDRVFHFIDVEHARQFLEAITADEHTWPLVQSLITAVPHLCGEEQLTRAEVVLELARHLARRTLLVVDGHFQTRPGGGKGKPSPPPPSQPPPPISPATFIEIELVDQDGRPVAHERYRITLPDGTVRSGRLDDRGSARIDGIRPAGPCDIEFPDIHGEEWEPA